MFTDDVSRADDQTGFLAAIFAVLRRLPEGGKGEDMRARADLGLAGNDDMRVNANLFGENDFRSDDRVRADLDVGPELRARLDNCCLVIFCIFVEYGSRRSGHVVEPSPCGIS
jgi:hypothetical protein